MMMITTRTETYYKIEMTAEQAHDLSIFFNALETSHVDQLAKIGTVTYRKRFDAAIGDMKIALNRRESS